jgi:ribonucleoside-diphosphate reductase alpha chain
MSILNALAQQILEAKYYSEGETTPEQLFMRVAKVVSIPDVIDRLLEHSYRLYPDTSLIFAPYEEIYNRVINRRHLKLDSEHGELLDPDDTEIKKIWKEEAKKYYDAMCNLEFMPATPTLINAGRPIGMLSSCFFLDVPDSMEGIMEVNKQLAIIAKLGGGVGLNISGLRPKGAPVATTAKGVSSGPVSFLRIYNETGNQVQQGGVRRAAMIALMKIDHPDILEFIACKEEEGVLTNFNISVLITDEFMQAIENNPDNVWLCQWQGAKYVIDKETNIPEIYNQGAVLDAEQYYQVKDIWEIIIDKAWSNGEPGIVFWDTVQRGDVFKGRFGHLGLNPCGEQLILNRDSCSLAAINLGKCWYYSDKDRRIRIDYDKLEKLVKLGVQFLDNTLDINSFPLPEIEEQTLKIRRIGLGTMGLHDLMLRKEIRYGSKESLALIDSVYSFIQKKAQEVSVHLGKIRGIPEALKDLKRRNAGLLTVQPTGTVSIICNQTSPGVEPIFQWSFTRKDSYGTHQMHHFMLDDYLDDLPDYAVTALEVSPKEHILIQSQVQKYIDSGISKTINAPNNTTREEVDKIFRLAYKTKCKSTTIYRTGSRQIEVQIKDKKAQEESEEAHEPERTLPTARYRGPVLFGATFKINTPGGKAYITVNEDDYGVREVFVHISKAGSEITTHVEVEGRLISHALKHGIPAKTLIGHLAGHKSNPIFDAGRSVKSVPDAVAIVLQEYLDRYEGFSEYIDKEPNTTEVIPKVLGEISGELCPDCGEVLYQSGGCDYCYCGFSRCG